MVESTATDQSMAPAASAVLSNRDNTASQMPSALILRCHVQIVSRRPKTAGTSRKRYHTDSDR